MEKRTLCIICEIKGADQVDADQRLSFRYTDCTIPLLSLLSKSKISSLWPSSGRVQPGLCRACSETTLLVYEAAHILLVYVCRPYLGIVVLVMLVGVCISIY